MREIALDTQAATAVAIIEDGRVIARAHNDSGRHHAESITPLVREALQAADLPATLGGAGIDRVLVGTGPAPFTGLRAGLVSARVLARVAGVPAYGVSALDVIARQGLDLLAPDTRVYAIADARRRELYWGSYLAAGPDDVTLEGRLEVGDVASLLAAMRHAPGLVVAGAPIPAHSAPALARADLGPQIELDPAVMSRIVATRLTRGESDRKGILHAASPKEETAW